jgi:hypothetical protein
MIPTTTTSTKATIADTHDALELKKLWKTIGAAISEQLTSTLSPQTVSRAVLLWVVVLCNFEDHYNETFRPSSKLSY